MQQAVLGVVDEYAGGDVHRIDEAQSFLHAALSDERRDGVGDVYESAPAGHFKPKLFSQRFHFGDRKAFCAGAQG
jgi:hypothetical protein